MLVASTSVFGVHCTTPAASLFANAAIAASLCRCLTAALNYGFDEQMFGAE